MSNSTAVEPFAAITGSRSTIEVNLEQVRQFQAGWDKRPFDQAQLEPFIAPDYVDHTRPQSDPALSDSQVIIGLGSAVVLGFPDGVHQTLLMEPVGQDKVLVFWRFIGTHTGEFFGIPPTGRAVDFSGIDLLTLRDGQIVEHRHVEELLKAMAQLGVMEP